MIWDLTPKIKSKDLWVCTHFGYVSMYINIYHNALCLFNHTWRTMYNFHNSTDIFVNPSYIYFHIAKEIVQVVHYFKIIKKYHI